MECSAESFSNVSTIYDYARPHYPPEIYQYLFTENIISKSSIVADIGCGTGIFIKPIIHRVKHIYAVEPNQSMLGSIDPSLKDDTNCTLVSGSAENTSLEACKFDAIFSAQAFHWFNANMFLKECRRIAKPGCYLGLLWNHPNTISSPATKETWALIKKYRLCLPHAPGSIKAIEKISSFLEVSSREKIVRSFFTGLKKDHFIGRVLSMSCLPDNKSPVYSRMLSDLEELFSKHQKQGLLKLHYNCVLISKRL